MARFAGRTMLNHRPIAAWILVLVIAAACTGSRAQIAAASCEGAGLKYVQAGWGHDVKLAASRSSSGTSVAEWLAGGDGPKDTAKIAEWTERGSEVVAVCYFEGDFSSFPGPPDAAEQYDRMLVLIPESGEPIVDTVGPSKVLDPAVGPAE